MYLIYTCRSVFIPTSKKEVLFHPYVCMSAISLKTIDLGLKWGFRYLKQCFKSRVFLLPTHHYANDNQFQDKSMMPLESKMVFVDSILCILFSPNYVWRWRNTVISEYVHNCNDTLKSIISTYILNSLSHCWDTGPSLWERYHTGQERGQNKGQCKRYVLLSLSYKFTQLNQV